MAKQQRSSAIPVEGILRQAAFVRNTGKRKTSRSVSVLQCLLPPGVYDECPQNRHTGNVYCPLSSAIGTGRLEDGEMEAENKKEVTFWLILGGLAVLGIVLHVGVHY